MRSTLIIIFVLIIFSPTFPQNYIAFFNDSPKGDAYYDASWGYATAPSYLELARNNDKFPIDSKHPLQGRHSLRLHWTSMSGGDWAIAVAAVGWYGFDFTQYDSIQYWINAPQAIARVDLPDLAVEDLSNHKSTRVWLGDYFMGVDDDSITWQKVAIPISAFQPGTENADFTKIKTIFHLQKNADGVEHIAWIDNIFVIKSGSFNLTPPDPPANLIATGHDSRIDLTWKPNLETDLLGYYIYRRSSSQADFARIKMSVHDVPVFSDFLGTNNQTNSYYVTAVNRALQESEPSDTVNATSRPMTDEELLTSVQEATFRYFYDFGHPVSGLARERNSSGDVCASGGTGMGLITIMVGAERGFVSRDSASARI